LGQQQLLLVVLGVFIIGIAVAVAIWMFRNNSQSSDRDQLVDALNNLAAKAEQYFRKPQMMAGGGLSFGGFTLGPSDTSDGENFYAITGIGSNPGPPTLSDYPTTRFDTGSPATPSDTTLIIGGWGVEDGDNPDYKVQVYVVVKPGSVNAFYVN